MQSCMVTGATGFVGAALCRKLHESGVFVKAAYRRSGSVPNFPLEVTPVAIGSIGPESQFSRVLDKVDTVLHLAARVHVMKDTDKEPLAAFRNLNTFGTETLARQAAAAGVRRFVYVSSIKVNGESTSTDIAFTEFDPHLPRDPYGISKSEAELALHRVTGETGMEIVIVRPPLVYGPGVKGNFERMLQALRRGLPLPLGTIDNRRSLVYVENLVDALVLCANHPAAANNTYLVSDDEDVSTPELLRKLAEALGTSARLFPAPRSFLRLGGAIFGKTEVVERLLDSLLVDSGKIKRELGWTPPFTLTEGLKKTAEWFKSNHA
jgi:nucleoside-diphosphate-sugar epimerase